MKLEILGTGCSKCKALENATKQAVAKAGVFAEVVKVEDITKIMDYGVTSTPALVVNGEVKSTGRVPNIDEIIALFS